MNAPSFRPALSDLALALGLLTRIPLPSAAYPAPDARPAAYAAWAYPLVGVVVGGLVWSIALLSLWLGLPVAAAAILALLAGVVTTGAMHEDGLADCADGFWGGWTPERRLEIMKDSQIGTYGVVALLGLFGLKTAALMALLGADGALAALLSAAMLSRAAMVLVMHRLPNARDAGLSRQTGRPPKNATLIACVIGMAAVILIGHAGAIWALLGAATAMFAAGAIAWAKIKGQTGDILGATQQVVEVTMLLIFAAQLT